MKKLILLAGLITLTAAYLGKELYIAGEFKEIRNNFLGKCLKVEGVYGPEDIAIDTTINKAFIVSDNRIPYLRGEQTGQEAQGAIFLYDLKNTNHGLTPLTQNFSEEFHPHGISLFHAKDGKTYLFVINHRFTGQVVERFIFQEGMLVHLESIRGELMTSPNDLYVVGPRQFYVANDHGNTSTQGKKIEDYLRLAKSYVLYYDGSTFRKVAQDLAYANGIQGNPDNNIVYILETTANKINVYHRNLKTGELKFNRHIVLDSAPDNVNLDSDGNLWIAGHPKSLTAALYLDGLVDFAPSQVIKVIPSPHADQVKEIFLDDGKKISASTSAARDRQTLLIGAVREPYFLHCTMSL